MSKSVELPGPMAEHLDKLADDALRAVTETVTLPHGIGRWHIRQIVRAIGRRSLADNGPDFPANTFINSSS